MSILYVCLLLCFIVGHAQVVPFTAKEAREYTTQFNSNREGPDFVNAVYAFLKAYVKQSKDFCLTLPLERGKIIWVSVDIYEALHLEESPAWRFETVEEHDKRFTETVERIWPFARKQLELDGYRIQEEYLRTISDPSCTKDRVWILGDVCKQEAARVTLCWG
jgi:hypothetical protein